MPYNYLFAIILGVLPSVIWLAFYLRKDIHPEPRKWLFLIFLAGMAIAPFVVAIEWQVIGFFNFLNSNSPVFFNSFAKNLAIVFIGIAAVEEFSKYLVVRFAMKKNPVFDEPADAMIYMIVSALGFAAVENIIVMHSFAPLLLFNLSQPLSTLAIRFIGATFLHTLSSAIIGFYYALSLTRMTSHSRTHRKYLMVQGFIIATLLHGAFNYFIIVLKEPLAIYFSIPLLIVAIYVMKEFKILQRISLKRFNN
ncbi:PrsW family intramembrane metalloprotease [Patescibacteria group bacterium]|nr:PrsW family intramembrane metalloprotease [Patescibacteria group bacterium]MBU4000092.1 PrsW family intramembrane metalloprotease [Patescibacteria group bacterium]MBU4056699.1 PrsW family intramembrane metalloprotease [Patescibacteria group bacterium]MBU4368096.1 PrsW family intramembrane metalloprotease [Patescibacteria group bacterium]